MNEQEKALYDIHMAEYQTLKTEQFQRIKVRDSVIYLTIAALGVILSLADKEGNSRIELLIMPWASLILGWIYLVNDEKISSIGRYIRNKLSENIKQVAKNQNDVFGWEVEHRSDSRRKERKYFQFIIDMIVFVIPAITCIGLYLNNYYYEAQDCKAMLSGAVIVCFVELIMIIYLAVKIFQYADFQSGK